MTNKHEHEHERTEATPPTTKPAAAPAQPKAGAPLRSINEPDAPSEATGDLPSINEPPGSDVLAQSKNVEHQPSPTVTNVARETKHETSRDDNKHMGRR